MSDYLYIFKSGDFHKIGITKNISRRLGDYSNYPSPAELVFAVSVKNARKLESELHSRYDSQKVNKEWFRFTDDQLGDLITELNEKGTPFEQDHKEIEYYRQHSASSESTELLQAHIPQDLAVQFKMRCAQKRIKQREAMAVAVASWLKENSD